MAATYVGVGAFLNSTAGGNVAWPATVNRGDMAVMWVINKHPPNGPSTPSGWTLGLQQSGGAGASAADLGLLYCTTFWKITSGSEGGGTQAITITSGNSSIAFISVFRSGKGGWMNPWFTGGADNTGGSTTVTITGSENIFITTGDYVYAVAGLNTDAFTLPSAQIAATGATLSNAGANNTTTGLGNDCMLCLRRYDCTAGVSSAAPVFTLTMSGSGTDVPTGPGIIVRLRDCPLQQVDMMGAGYL